LTTRWVPPSGGFQDSRPERSRRVGSPCSVRKDGTAGPRLPSIPRLSMSIDPAKPRFPCPTPTGRVSYRR